MVGFLTFFINENDFNERIMVSVTNLLVIATIVTGIQAVSNLIELRSNANERPRATMLEAVLRRISQKLR